MKKVLIIAYAFPPHQAIGSQRPYGLAKYFPQHGWKPVVLTVDRPGETPKGIKVIKAEHHDLFQSIKSLIRNKSGQRPKSNGNSPTIKAFNSDQYENKLNKLIREVIYFPDSQRGWYKTAIKAAIEYLDKEKVDAVISTSSPETDHLIAKTLKKMYKIPWIADFRDPWTQNTYRDKFALINYLERKLELKTMSGADAIVTVTEPWIKLLASLHKGKQIYCIPNGYDEDDFIEKTTKLTNKFTITYAGSLYKGKRDPSLLFNVMNQLIQEKKIDRDLIEVRFYGPKEERLTKQVKESNMEDIIHFYGKLPREEVINKLMESQLLLLLLWNSKNESGFCPGKIYEYFGAGRPVIAIGWAGSVVKDLLEKTGAGKYADSPDTLKKVLLEYYGEFIEFGKVKCFNGNIDKFNYSSIANKYSEVLNSLKLNTGV